MANDLDQDLELVRKLHLELNGSGRRTRGCAPQPTKRLKRDSSRHTSEDRRDTPSASRSGSGSGSGSARLARREGTLRRLVKKQPDTDSTHHTGLDDDLPAVDPAAGRDVQSLEPQASTRAEAKDPAHSRQGGDVRSWQSPVFTGVVETETAMENAAKLACAAEARDASNPRPRVKCFYQGYPYGLSLASHELASPAALGKAIEAAVAPDRICPTEQLVLLALDGQGRQVRCSANDEESWNAALRGAKRIYCMSSVNEV